MTTPPVFVVGLPRSGSTLLSWLLNASPELASINDLYYVQVVLAHGADRGALDSARFRLLLDALLGRVLRRATDDDPFIGQLRLPEERIPALRRTLLEAHAATPMDWSTLQDRALSEVAALCGKRGWADKTPQNFLHLDRLGAAFPKARFVFVVRDPRQVLASLKHASGKGHDARRYHPWVYALYWRSAARAALERRSDPRAHLLRYEDLVDRPARAIADLNRFLGIRIPLTGLPEIGRNTSFPAGRRKELNGTESWICDRVCARELPALGYAPQRRRPAARELPGLAAVTARFTVFQLSRGLADRDSRARIRAFCARLARSRYRPRHSRQTNGKKRRASRA